MMEGGGVQKLNWGRYKTVRVEGERGAYLYESMRSSVSSNKMVPMLCRPHPTPHRP